MRERKTNAQRVAAVAFAVFAMLLGGATVFGFQSLLPLLRKEGIFSTVCHDTQNHTVPKPSVNCTARDLQFNLLYTVASSTANFLSIVVGPVVDATSPRFAGAVGFGLLGLGFALLGILKDAAVFAGMLLLAAGAPFIMISSFFVEQLVPRHASIITVVLVAALNASPAIFLFVALLSKYASGSAVLGGFGGLCAVCIAVTWLLYHQRDELHATDLDSSSSGASADDSGRIEAESNCQNAHERTRLLVNDQLGVQPTKATAAAEKEPAAAVGSIGNASLSGGRNDEDGVGGGGTCTRVLPTWLQGPGLVIAVGECLFLAALSLAANFYLGSLEQQLKWKEASSSPPSHDRPDIDLFMARFNWILPLGCALSATLLGPLAVAAERHDADWLPHLAAVLLVLLPLLLETLAPVEAQWATFPMYALGFTAPWAVVPEMVRRWFPVARRGTILAIIIAFTATVGLLTYPLTAMALAGGSFLGVNGILMGITGGALALPVYLVVVRGRLVRARILYNPGTAIDWTKC